MKPGRNKMERLKAKEVLRRAFSIRGDTASFEEIEDRILDAGEVKGTNLVVLVLAIFIASIGLNMNSTAVIIGAMLISPLMGCIMAMGYGFATGDLAQIRNSFLGLVFEVIVCLITSTVYFSISPITTATSELLARTTPTIWDVLIACFGGLAGIIGVTRKEKSNVIPGVAIATALMPPLCTAGYGLSVGSWKYFAGAMYLFLINTYFIALTSTIMLLVMKIPTKIKISSELRKRLMKRVAVSTVIFVIPSVIFAGTLVRREMQENTVVYENNAQYFDVERLSKELSIIYPEFSSLEVGYLDSWDKETDTNAQKLTVFVYCDEEFDKVQKRTIEELLKIEIPFDEITYMKSE